MDKWLKMSLVASVLLAGVSVFYYFVIFLPSVENRKFEAAKAQAAKAETVARERKEKYDACVKLAETSYYSGWAAACKEVAEIDKAAYENCMKRPYATKVQCDSTYGKINTSPDCSLPKSRADGVNKYFSDAKESCLSEAKLGL